MKTKKQFRVRLPYILGLVAVVALGIGVWVWSHPAGSNTAIRTNTKSSPRASEEASGSSSSTPTPAPVSKGSGSVAGNSSSESNTAAAPSGPALITPTGQILNTNVISLSATSGPEAPNMESTVFKGQPGAMVSMVASLNGGADKTVATGGAIDASGEYPQAIDWNAKAVGLTAGQWSVRIKTTLNGKVAYSQSSILEIKP